MPDVLITGAGGWIGRSALDLFLPRPDQPTARDARGFARSAREVHVGNGLPCQLEAMESLFSSPLAEGSLLVLCGFPTQDQVDVMGAPQYVDAITELRHSTQSLLRQSPPVDVIYLSSGAATGVDNDWDVPERTRVYGQAKLDDEIVFREVSRATGGRLCVIRAFALSGAYMTKPDTYALGNMIMQALGRGAIEVQATHPVRRSFMAVHDMLRLAAHSVGELPAGGWVTFETAGEVVEMGQLAERVLQVLGRDPAAVTRPPIDPGAPPDDYLGDPAVLTGLAARAGLVPASLDDQIAATAAWLSTGGRWR